MSNWKAERARVASLTRSREADDPDLVAARQRLKAARLADHVRDTLESWPPLTHEQADAIATLLRPVGGAAK